MQARSAGRCHADYLRKLMRVSGDAELDPAPSYGINTRLRVSVVCATAPLDVLGGLQRRIITLIKGFAMAGVEVSIVQSRWAASGSTATLGELAQIGVESRVIDVGAPPSHPATLARIFVSRQLSRFVADSDIVDLYDPAIGVGREGRAPWVYSAIGLIPYYLDMWVACGLRQAALGLYRSAFEPLAMRRASGLIVENAGMARFARRFHRMPAERIAIIPGGYHQALVSALVEQPVGTSVVYSGRLSWSKGLRELLSAFARVATTRSTWRLQLIGDGPDLGRLQSLSKTLGIHHLVQFTGRLPPNEVLPIVAGGAIFVLPSYIESLPLALIEAMALGRPVIATDVGGIREHLVRNGQQGVIVRSKSSSELADALATLMDDPDLRLRMGIEARLRVASLTNARLVDSTLAFYRETLATRPGSPGAL